MKYILIIIFALLVIAALSFFAFKGSDKVPMAQKSEEQMLSEEVNIRASFLIFTNGTKRDFSASRYHNLTDFVYLVAENPTTIHVKKKGVTWEDFFGTLPMKLTENCLTTGAGQLFCSNGFETLKFYLNGVKTEGVLDKEIKDGDKFLISYGEDNEEEIKRQLNQIP